MLYQHPAAATKRLLGISRSSSSWPRSYRWTPPLPRPRSSWPRPLTSPCLRPPVSSPPTTSTKSTPIGSSARASCSSCRYSQKGSPPVLPQSMRPPRGRCRPCSRSRCRSPLSHNQPFQIWRCRRSTRCRRSLSPMMNNENSWTRCHQKRRQISCHSSPLWHCPEKVDAETDSEGGRKLTRLSIDLRILLVFHV